MKTDNDKSSPFSLKYNISEYATVYFFLSRNYSAFILHLLNVINPSCTNFDNRYFNNLELQFPIYLDIHKYIFLNRNVYEDTIQRYIDNSLDPFDDYPLAHNSRTEAEFTRRIESASQIAARNSPSARCRKVSTKYPAFNDEFSAASACSCSG